MYTKYWFFLLIGICFSAVAAYNYMFVSSQPLYPASITTNNSTNYRNIENSRIRERIIGLESSRMKSNNFETNSISKSNEEKLLQQVKKLQEQLEQKEAELRKLKGDNITTGANRNNSLQSYTYAGMFNLIAAVCGIISFFVQFLIWVSAGVGRLRG